MTLTREEGGVTAEFAVAMPAVLIVLAACVGGIQVAATQVSVQATAASAARALARGDGMDAATSLVHRALAHATVAQSADGELVCARVQARATGIAGLAGLELGASVCDAGGDG